MKPITTERLVLREFVQADWRAVQGFYTGQGAPTRTTQESQLLATRIASWQHEQPRRNYRFVLITKSTAQFIGWCDLYLDSCSKQAEIGFRVDKRYEGQGYASEAAQAVLEWGFTTLQLSRIWGECEQGNARSMGVMEKIGLNLIYKENGKLIFARQN